jgi:hypothetical protein
VTALTAWPSPVHVQRLRRVARSACQQALDLFQQLEDPSGEAVTWDSVGYAHRADGPAQSRTFAAAACAYKVSSPARERTMDEGDEA